MTAQTTAREVSPEEIKARQKAEGKKMNKQLEALGHGFDNLTHAIYGAQDRVAEVRKAVAGFAAQHPTQALLDYLHALDALLAKGIDMAQEQGTPAQEVLAEHFFPGRAARWAAEAEERNQDRRTEQMERYAGYSGE